MRILVTGATGYIGPLLARRLLELGHDVRCLVRNPDRLDVDLRDSCEIAVSDVLNYETLLASLAWIEVAYYLIHSMASGEKKFMEFDRVAAENFGRAAMAVGVKRIVYLGGIGAEDQDLSPHLRSRHETGRKLAEAGVPVTEFRAGSIIGSGSLAFEIVRYLVERLPVMICPRWMHGKTQPIAIDDVLRYLTECLELPETAGRVLEIGGADVVSYADMMLTYARVRGLKRLLFSVPVLSPKLSSYWVGLVTPLPARIVKPIILGLKSNLYCRDGIARELFPFEPIGYEQAVRAALASSREKVLNSVRFNRYLERKTKAATGTTIIHTEGMIIERRRLVVPAGSGQVFAVIKRLGGENSWPFADRLWRLRMLIDRLLGGVARPQRRDPDDLEEGDLIDFWEVEKLDENHLLRLRISKMLIPGRTWLQFRLERLDSTRTELTQTFFFEPRGLAGVFYWVFFYPLHKWIFRGLIEAISKHAIRISGLAP